jgi:hypothetical protein
VAVDHPGDDDAAEYYPCQQCQRFAHVLGAAQQLLLVALAKPTQQKPADKAGDKPAAACRLSRCIARACESHDRDFHPMGADPLTPLGKA